MDSSEKRCLRITNSRQFQVLVTLMQENTQLAKCWPTSDKISMEEAWNDVAREVNIYGPPKRTGNEWKKIWCDLKSRTKKKIENSKNSEVCGEGSCRMLYLNDLEQAVDKILNFSARTTSHVLNIPPKDTTFDSVFDEVVKPCEVKNEPDVTVPSIQIVEEPETKRTRPAPQFRSLGKRKYDKADKQFKLLQQQVKSQERLLEVMQMQARSTKAIAEATSRQAEALATIAESSKSIALALQDTAKYLKRD